MRSIAFLIRALTIGGAQRQLVELAQGLQGRGWKVTVLTFYDGGALADELLASDVRVISLRKGGRWDVAAFLGRLLRVLRDERPDILHPYLPDANNVASALKPLLGGVRVVWGIRASDMDLSRYDWLSSVSFRASVLLSRSADLIICNSRAGADFHRSRGYATERMTVVHNGIDVARFRPDAEARARGRARWGITGETPVIGIVGRLDPMKDHMTFIAAAELLSRDDEDVRFVCVGDGPAGYTQELMQRAQAAGLADRIVWAGATTDLVAAYNALDLCTLSSAFGEGFPNVVGEAMACGVPCVVTDVGDAAEVLGDRSRVVPARDPEALCHAWRIALAAGEDERTRVRERVATTFSIEALVSRSDRELSALIT